MNARIINALCAGSAALALSLSAVAADTAAETTVKLVQEQLHHHGFYSGRIDGDLSGEAQAALVQFQLAHNIPASGALDDQTLAALGVQRQQDTQIAQDERSAAAGGSAASRASPEQKVD